MNRRASLGKHPLGPRVAPEKPQLRGLARLQSRSTAKERAEPRGSVFGAILAGVNFDALRPTIEARITEMREAFAGAPAERRAAFHSLLGELRLRVLADAERDGFRVEGLLELTLERRDARAEIALASRIGGSGGGI